QRRTASQEQSRTARKPTTRAPKVAKGSPGAAAAAPEPGPISVKRVTLPLVGARVPMVRVRVGDGGAAKQVRSVARAPGPVAPRARQRLFCGGAGLLAVGGGLGGPVAAGGGLGAFGAPRSWKRSGRGANG